MGSALPTTPTTTTRMAQVQGNNLLDVLKKKMRQTKEEMEKYKEESEDMARKLQVEIRRREEAEGEVAALNRRTRRGARRGSPQPPRSSQRPAMPQMSPSG